MTRLILVAAALTVVAACSGAPGQTAQPTAAPTGAIPTAAPTAPSTDAAPSQAPVTGSACDLVPAAALTTIFGGTVNVAADDAETPNSCTITPPSGQGITIPLVIRYGTNETIEAAKMVISDGTDLSVAGHAAYYGDLMGGILYVDAGGGQTVVVQAPLQSDMQATLVRIAEVALANWP